ncbi:GNAT family N-acetyltransferase [Tenacibaculum sp. 190524A02b]|uniref:GNAT family N-acetyltransferase n=1 Tax=Tenacibaculum vairaonense TaxID=3137860 RepID=UPI0031FB82DA
MNTYQLNIQNLTTLWKIAGKTFSCYYTANEIHSVYLKNSSWPNRIWINTPLNHTLVNDLKKQMTNLKGVTFSYFNRSKQKSSLVGTPSFSIKSIQYGMHLDLRNMKKYQFHNSLNFIQVHNKEEAILWSDTFYQAFNYIISVETLLKTLKDIQYFLVFNQEEIIGTVVLFNTYKIAGIHSLGIIPSQRNKGFASKIMKEIINLAIDKNMDTATLQASEMAKNMYLNLGFTFDFLMENYLLNE